MNKKLFIEGMSCNHCVKHVQSALKDVDGVVTVKVDLKEKTALVELSKAVDNQTLNAAVSDLGYEVTKIEG